MRTLTKPLAKPGKVYSLCISKVRSKRLRARLRSAKQFVVDAAGIYEAAAIAAKLHTLPHSQPTVGKATAKELVGVYTRRMVPKRAPGRPVYDAIMAGAPGGRCPLCGVGQVSTLDHHLPKSAYPTLAVLPLNLVPACSWCQGEKMDAIPRVAADQTLHPYFDDFDGARWLHAEVIRGAPAAFRFFVQGPPAWSKIKVERLRSHIKSFRLDVLFSTNAADEVVGIRHGLAGVFAANGYQGVRIDLKERADSWEAGRLNSWQTAMYRTAETNDWFCKGGFAKV